MVSLNDGKVGLLFVDRIRSQINARCKPEERRGKEQKYLDSTLKHVLEFVREL